MLHHYLENFGLGEEHLELTADNCAGQNKNAYVMWYLCWRMANHLHQTASISFMLAGHTKFAPDWCFGLFKRQYRRTFVSSLHDIEQVVNASSLSSINKSAFVGNENGDVHIPTYDWINFLKPHFKKVTGIKSNHHFMFSAGRPGIVTMKLFCDSPTTEQQLTVTPCPLQMPPVLVTKGLENKRKKYLFNEIRQFCHDETKDIVCPKPEPPLQPTTDDVPADGAISGNDNPKAAEESAEPQAIRDRTCHLLTVTVTMSQWQQNMQRVCVQDSDVLVVHGIVAVAGVIMAMVVLVDGPTV